MALSRVKLTPIYRGDPRTIVVTIKDPQGVPIDLSGSTWRSTVRTLTNSSVGTQLEVLSDQLAAGVIGLKLSGLQSKDLSNTLEGDLQGSGFGTVLEFHAIVRGDVTKEGSLPESGLVDTITLTWGLTGSTLSSAVLAILVPGGVSNVQGVSGLWAGTQVAYDALPVKNPTVLYLITS